MSNRGPSAYQPTALPLGQTGSHHLISVTVFNFTRPPVLSAPLLILSASRFLAPPTVGSRAFSVFRPSTWNMIVHGPGIVTLPPPPPPSGGIFRYNDFWIAQYVSFQYLLVCKMNYSAFRDYLRWYIPA